MAKTGWVDSVKRFFGVGTGPEPEIVEAEESQESLFAELNNPPDMALFAQRIAENKRTRATHLYLGDCRLRSVPEEIAELEWLEHLSISVHFNKWEDAAWRMQYIKNGQDFLHDISALSKLPALQTLQLDSTKIENLHALQHLTHLQVLDVSATSIADLTPLANLRKLRHLLLGRSKANDLTPLAALTNLEELYLLATSISDLRPIARLQALTYLNINGTLIVDFSALAEMRALQSLYLNNTKIVDLLPLATLVNLRFLDLRVTQVRDLAPLKTLINLKTLLLGGTAITDLQAMANLQLLKNLRFDNTAVSDLQALSHLRRLETLSFANTQVSDLRPILPLIQQGVEVHFDDKSWFPGIHLKGCPLTNPPVEIVQQGNAAILNYFAELDQQGTTRLFEAKMLILGKGGSGKTSLLRRLYLPQETLPEECETTMGIDILPQYFSMRDGQQFRLNVWDFGGQEIYHATHQFFLTRRSLYVLLDDTREDHKGVNDPGFKYWLDLIDTLGGRSPVLIFQNEKGGRSKEIDLAGIKGQFENVKERYRGNLQFADAADSLRAAIELFASQLEHIGDALPSGWVKVRQALETRANQVPHISLAEYFEIYTAHLPFERSKARHLSQYLHDLGVFLHFQAGADSVLDRLVILQNTWATQAVYQILNDEAIKARHGRFTPLDCQRIWHAQEYQAMHPELLALMQRFELCYELPHALEKTWLAPQLLPAARPAMLENWAQPQDLVLRYHYSFLPKGMLGRLMVRLHRLVREPDAACISALLFARDDAVLLASLLPTGEGIELRARGPEARLLLARVADELDAMHDAFSGLREKVEKLLPCSCALCQQALVPHLFHERMLKKRQRDGKTFAECEQSYSEMPIAALFAGVQASAAEAHQNDSADGAESFPERGNHIHVHLHNSHIGGDLVASGEMHNSLHKLRER